MFFPLPDIKLSKKYCDIHNEGGPVLQARNDRVHCKDYCGVVEMSISAPELWEAPESPSVPYSVNLPHPAVCVRSAKLLRLLCFFHIPAGGVFCLINKIELPICLVWAIIVKQLNPTVKAWIIFHWEGILTQLCCLQIDAQHRLSQNLVYAEF